MTRHDKALPRGPKVGGLNQLRLYACRVSRVVREVRGLNQLSLFACRVSRIRRFRRVSRVSRASRASRVSRVSRVRKDTWTNSAPPMRVRGEG
jgi:hypothetical protein